ncbi:MAG: type I-E CRISPR-associated protein Cse1/CasA, partial [Rhodobacteraceae bacterium]|nr:type I-E CRISPR-associated protein Cse1/CasA [Paracoccaceae bacterium]
DLVWANVPDGQPADPDILRWMRPTRTSEAKGSEVYPAPCHPAEAFFGQPRRLRLTGQGDRVTGVFQKPYGTNYAGWEHPLTPYYRQKAGSELLPLHPRAGAFGYRNWLGVVMTTAADQADTRRRAQAVATYERRVLRKDRQGSGLIVAGWAMDNMKPRDFTLSHQPLLSLDEAADDLLRAMITAADTFASLLRSALKPLVREGQTLDALREAFFIDTQAGFDAGLAALSRGEDPIRVAAAWLAVMERVALTIFDRQALPGLDRRRPPEIEAITGARDDLRKNFAGWVKPGTGAVGDLGLTPRARKAVVA